MTFCIKNTLEILTQTPPTLQSLLGQLSTDWTDGNEGQNTWSAFDIVGHLIHGELTDWLVRVHIILKQESPCSFTPFDREAQFEASKNLSIADLLGRFAQLRAENLSELQALNITETQLQLTGEHPEFGTVSLRQLLASWAVHDLGHLAQIARVMTKQYQSAVGPWLSYLPILQQNKDLT